MKILSFLILILAANLCFSQPEKIYQWRGENRSGIFNEKNLLKVWPENGPVMLWSNQEIGNGYGSPVVAGDKIYITGEIDSMANLFCLGLDGKIVWKKVLGKEWVKSFPGSRPEPTVVGNLIYVGTGMGNLYCVDAQTRQTVWEKDFVNDFQGQYPLHGHSEAPLTDGNKIFWFPGGKEFNVVALDRFTGKLIWSNKGMGQRPAYNSPNLIRLPGRTVLAGFTAYELLGLDAETGQLLWVHAQDNTPVEQRDMGIGDTHSNTVIYDGNALFYAEGDGNCGVRLDLSADGADITEAWRNTDLDGYMGGIIKIGNYLYSCGSAKKELKSFDATTGQKVDSLQIGIGSLIAADNMLYYYNHRGEISLVSYNGEGKMEQVSSFKIKLGAKEHFAHPVISDGVLYQRHGNTLMAFDIRKK